MILVSLALAGTPELDAHVLLQAEAGVVHDDDSMALVRLRRVRPLAQVRLPDDGVSALVQFELAGTPALLDARADLSLTEHFSLAIGQQIVTVSRAWNTPLHLVALGDRSLANNRFTPGRRLGAIARIHDGAVAAELGVFRPEPTEALENPPFPMVSTRMQLSTEGARPFTEIPGRTGDTTGIAVGLGVLVEPADAGGARATGTVDVACHTAGFSILGEVFGRHEGELATGASLQVGQLFPGDHVDVVGRGEVVSSPTERPQLRGTVGVTAYRRQADLQIRVQGYLGSRTDVPPGKSELGAKVMGQVRI